MALNSAPAATAWELDRMARVVNRLSLYYALFAGLNVVLAAMGLLMTRLGWAATTGPWEPWPHPPLMEWTYMGAAAWSFLVIRLALALAAWDGLRTRVAGGRRIATLAGAMAFTQFPIGLMLGGYTLVSLMGRRSSMVYASLAKAKGI